MKIYVSRKNPEVTAKIDEAYTTETTVILDYLTGDKKGSNTCITKSTLKRWWKETDIEQVPEVPEENLESTGYVCKEEVSTTEEIDTKTPIKKARSSKPKKVRTPHIDRTDIIGTIFSTLKDNFDIKTYDGMKNYYILRRKGEKKAFAEVRCGKRVQISVKSVSDYIRDNVEYKDGYKYFLPVHTWVDYTDNIMDVILSILG